MADVVLDCATLEREGVTVKVYTPDGTPRLTVNDRYLVENNGRMGVFVQTGADATTVTVEIPQTLDGQAVTPRRVEVPANTLKALGHWPTEIYNNALAQVALSFSAVAGVKLFCACL